jgi:hypothetical protein
MASGKRIPKHTERRALKNQNQEGQNGPHGANDLQDITRLAQPGIGKQSDVKEEN